MSTILGYVNRTTGGMEQFFAADKTVALVLAVLFLFWLKENKPIDEKGNRLLMYTMFATVLLLCPFTAVLGVIYQTAFYDYEWLWSMVPVTTVLSYAAVLLYDKVREKTYKKQKLFYLVVFAILLFWCGNQGVIKTTSSMEAEQREKAKAVAEILMEEASGEKLILWAPASVMQETRRQTACVDLVYGRDMWEPKAGAYDYEVYSDSIISAYEWMKTAEDIAGNGETILKVLRILWEMEEMNAGLQEVLPVLIENDVNAIVIPIETVELFEDTFFAIIEERGFSAEEIIIESYMLYRLR